MKSALIKIPEKVASLIEAHGEDLKTAWANIGDGALTINFPVKIGLSKNGKQTCEVGISFVMEKCQDSETFTWDDSQLSFIKNGGK